eukprot:scaffold614_cov163-Amphora_coffeaeformis.AAC.7
MVPELICQVKNTATTTPSSPSRCSSSSSCSCSDVQHRLDFAKVKHCGRHSELKRLKSMFHDCCKAERPAACSVIVQAGSGLGKTALVDTFVQQVVREEANCVLVGRGKFEEATAASEPFAAIIGATNDLLHQLASSEEHTLWTQLIKEALASDTNFLADIIPGLETLLFGKEGGGEEEEEGRQRRRPSARSTDSFSLDGFGDMTDKEWRFERFRLGLRALLRCISTRKPVLFVLDDMHWAEQDSVTVIWTIMEDTFPNRRLMILGASRLLQTNAHMKLMTQRIDEHLLHLMTLDVLRVKDVTKILASLFACTPEEVTSLAQVVHSKSNGNTFVILQFIRISEQQGHIFYSPKDERWIWDESSIVAHASIADSVTEVVANKLLSVDRERKAALITAACFGRSHFEVDTIVHAMKLMSEESFSSDTLDNEAADYDEVDPYVVRQNIRQMKETLRSATKDGLVEEISEGHFRFSHDRIREAAYSLLPEGLPRTKLHLKIGRQLRSWMETQSELFGDTLSEESLLLNATNQLNLGANLIEDDWERLDLAELNYQAAEYSARKCSFVPAMDFLIRGILQLGENRWEKHYPLTVKLTVALTRIQFCCGMYDTCLETADEVIKHGKSFADKKPIYHTKLLALLYEERQEEATDLCLSVLDSLGIHFPRKLVLIKAHAHHAAIDKRLRSLASAQLMDLPDSYDPDGKVEDALGFIKRLAEISFYGGDDAYLVHCTNKLIQLALDHGRISETSFAFFGFAWVKAVGGQLDEARRLAEVSMYYATERRCPIHDMRSEYMNYAFFRMYKSALTDMVDPMHDVQESLRRAGAMEMILMDGYYFHRLAFASGVPLSNLIEKCAEYNEILLDYRQPMFWSINAPMTQAILNLMGHTDNPRILTGDHMNEELHVNLWLENGNKKALTQYRFFRMVIATLLREYDVALEIVAQMPALMADGLDIFVPFRVFFNGLALIAISKKKRLKRALRRREAYKLMKKLNEWDEAGMSWCKHMELILRAEAFSTSKENRAEIEKAYRVAIESAKASGVIQNEALANELAGRWMAAQTGKEESYAPYLMKAATLYEAWGAAVKVDDIMRGFPQCFGEQPAFQYKSSRTMPMTGSFSSSMWSTSLYNRSLREPPKLATS